MAYVFDTNCFIVIGHYYPEQFPSFWNKFDQAVEIGKIISVREVFRELDQDASAPHLSDWIEHHKNIFMIPNAEATQFVSTIFSFPHFQALVSEKKSLSWSSVRRSVYHCLGKGYERLCCYRGKRETENAAKIPNVCHHFGIDCTNLQGFMEREDWSF